MGLYFNLKNKIDCKLLCRKIGEYIEDMKREGIDINTSILSINISNISHTSNELIPKLESKDQEPKES